MCDGIANTLRWQSERIETSTGTNDGLSSVLLSLSSSIVSRLRMWRNGWTMLPMFIPMHWPRWNVWRPSISTIFSRPKERWKICNVNGRHWRYSSEHRGSKTSRKCRLFRRRSYVMKRSYIRISSTVYLLDKRVKRWSCSSKRSNVCWTTIMEHRWTVAKCYNACSNVTE